MGPATFDGDARRRQEPPGAAAPAHRDKSRLSDNDYQGGVGGSWQSRPLCAAQVVMGHGSYAAAMQYATRIELASWPSGLSRGTGPKLRSAPGSARNWLILSQFSVAVFDSDRQPPAAPSPVHQNNGGRRCHSPLTSLRQRLRREQVVILTTCSTGFPRRFRNLRTLSPAYCRLPTFNRRFCP
jgi:hypothetical protein